SRLPSPSSTLLPYTTLFRSGAGGMGKIHAKVFAREGAKIVLADLSSSDGEKVAEEFGDQATFIELDVTDEENWIKLVEKTEERFGPINILVNNAGIVVSKSIED